MTAGNKHVWQQMRASRVTIVRVCCAVGLVHNQGTFSEPCTNDILMFEKLSDFAKRDTNLYTGDTGTEARLTSK
jgi:hypothetical protein